MSRLTVRDRGSRMPVNDSWIAAAIAHGLVVVTLDADYIDLLDLEVIRA